MYVDSSKLISVEIEQQSPRIVKDFFVSQSDRSYDHKNNGVLKRVSKSKRFGSIELANCGVPSVIVRDGAPTIAFLLNCSLPFRYLSAVDLVTLS